LAIGNANAPATCWNKRAEINKHVLFFFIIKGNHHFCNTDCKTLKLYIKALQGKYQVFDNQQNFDPGLLHL
jgi:hypothetical protein